MEATTTYTDTELVALLKKRDIRACDFLVGKYAGALHNLISEVVTEEEEATETLKETFQKITSTIHSYDPSRSRLFTWMLQLARETALTKLRNKNSRISFVVSTLPTRNGIISNALEKMDKDQQVLVSLAYYNGFSAEDAASQLNIPAEQAQKKLRTALFNLNNLLS